MISILTLDDSNVIRSLLKLTLESDGIQVDCASTVEEAMQHAIKKQYDMIIIDYMLEDGRNGLELVKKMKKLNNNADTPCIMLSAEDGDNCKEDARSLGVKAWLKKPFTPVGILKIVYKVLELNETRPDTNKDKSKHNA